MRTSTIALLPALVAAAAGAAPPLSRSFQTRPPAAKAPAARPAGLSQPMPAADATKPAAPGAAPSRSAPPGSVGPSGSTVTASYKISPGDQIDIYVWGDDRLQRSLSVLPDGTFAFPLAGTIRASGRTPNEIETELSRLLAAQYKGVAPQVTVSVRQPSGMQIAVIGKVGAPTTIAPTRYVTVLDALALTGGPTPFADIKHIVVLRPVNGRTTILRTKLADALKGRAGAEQLGPENNPVLMTGDTVVVP